MRINVLLPTGTRTVDLDELKTLVRQGVVQPSTLLETGGQRGKAKNVPALKPLFAELAAAPTQAPTPEPPVFEPTQTTEPPVFSSVPTPPEPPQIDASPTFSDFSPVETPQPAPPLDDVYQLEEPDAVPNASATETPFTQNNHASKWSWNWRNGLVSPGESVNANTALPQATILSTDDKNTRQIQSPELKQALKDAKTCEKKIGNLKSRKQFACVAFIVAQVIVFFYMLSVCVDPFFNRFDVASERNESYYGASVSVIEAELIGLYDFSYFNLIFCVVAFATLYGLRVFVECALDRNILEFQREKERLIARRQFLENANIAKSANE